MHEGYQLVAHRSVFVKFPLKPRDESANPAGPRRKPARLDHDPLDALQQRRRRRQSEADVSARSSTRTRSTTSPRAPSPPTGWRSSSSARNGSKACPSSRRWSKSSRKKAATKSSARSPATTWSAGIRRAVRRAARPARIRPAIPREIAEVVRKQGWGPEKPAREIHRVVAWDMVGEAEGTGIVHIAPGCGKEDFQLGKDRRPRRRSRRSTIPACSCPASAR